MSHHAARAWTGRERAHTLGTCLGSGVDIRDERMRAAERALFCVRLNVMRCIACMLNVRRTSTSALYALVIKTIECTLQDISTAVWIHLNVDVCFTTYPAHFVGSGQIVIAARDGSQMDYLMTAQASTVGKLAAELRSQYRHCCLHDNPPLVALRDLAFVENAAAIER